MGSTSWWLKNVVIGIFSVLFLIFGIDALMSAYRLKNALEFVMYFFSSSLIILISIVGILYPFFQIHAFLKPQEIKKHHEEP